ncbi:MAG: metal ABC transporter permease [Zoogloeaceae bacterium]|jgi:zinc transport system permease protein|nr:metal ABC transporter permease [Zoogloeaceae bacterium]
MELQLELFWRPCLTGAALALLLPLLGLYLRLRGESWAALAYGQIGAAGALGALALGIPTLLGGLAASLMAAGCKPRLERWQPGAGLFPLLFLLGWSASLLLAANLPAVEGLGAALFEGQLYFVSREMLGAAFVMLALGVAYLRRTGWALLLLSLHPVLFLARGMPAWPARIGFDLLVAASLALAVMCLGVMGAFALVFIPPWLAFVLAPSWRKALFIAPLLGFLTYSLAFVLALYNDQPFGPILALTLTLTAFLLLSFGKRGTEN